MTFSRALLYALLPGLLSLSSPVLADDDPRKAQAEPVFVEGLKLHDAGHEGEALAKFQRAYELYPSPNALFQIGRSEQLLGRNADALRHYREALGSALLHPRNAELARGFSAELEGTLARVMVSGPAGARCAVGGADVTLPHAEPVDVEPGEIVARCASGATELEGRATAAKGQLARLELRASRFHEPAKASDAAAVEPPRAREGHGFWTPRRTVGVAAGGVALVAAGVGGVFLASREAHVSDGKDVLAKTPQPCADAASASCRAYDDARDGVKSAGLSAGLSFGAFAALGVTAAVLILWPSGQRAARLRVSPLERELSVVGTF